MLTAVPTPGLGFTIEYEAYLLTVLVAAESEVLPNWNLDNFLLNFQEVVTVLLDTGINGGDFSPLNKVGVVVCFVGVALHVFRKVRMGGFSDDGGKSKVNAPELL